MTDTLPARDDPPALAALKTAYRSPVRQVLDGRAGGDSGAGLPPVAILGGGFPVEIAMAAGTHPVLVRPDNAASLTHAGRYLRPSMPQAVSRRLDLLLDGSLDRAALAVMTSRFEIDALLYHAAKAVLMRGEAPDMPPLHLFVLLTEAQDCARDYSLLQARLLAGRLEAVCGVRATGDRIEAAIVAMNAVRACHARLIGKRLQGLVSGADCIEATGGARMLPAPDAARLLESWLGDIGAGAPALSGRPRLLLTSSGELCHSLLHEALEEAGGLVALEDGDWGARSFGPVVELRGRAPFDAVVEETLLHTPNPAVYPHTARLAWFYEQARRPEIDAAVFHIPYDEAPLGWDYPRLARFMNELGKPCLLVREDPGTADGRAAIVTATRGFLQTARVKMEA